MLGLFIIIFKFVSVNENNKLTIVRNTTKIVMALLMLVNISFASIIPRPNKIIYTNSTCAVEKSIKFIDNQNKFKSSIEIFTTKFQEDLNIQVTQKSNFLVNLVFDNTLGNEAYELIVNKHGIEIKGNETGVFYGLQSLFQLLFQAQQNNEFLKTCRIEDSPRYAWRGFMVDESRHFFGKAKIKELIDNMAFHKLNKFHWHLTDTDGWRIEIKAYPKLTSIGGKGDRSNPDGDAKYYTQKEIKEIIQYAKERAIEVIPEIDMPGHAAAANRAYPEYSGGGSEKYPHFTFNPGNPATFIYLKNILKEVADLFPSKYIHFGGDEVHFGNHQWKTDKYVKKLMLDKNLKDLKEVEFYFANKVVKTISELGKVAFGWDEMVDADADTEKCYVMWWRHDREYQLKNALDKKYKVVLCPRRPLYFDFVQHDSHKVGRRWGGFCPLDLVYHYPMHKDIDVDSDQILGLQANLWSETVVTDDRFDFLTYPRISALAEAAWTNEENKNYEQFVLNLKNVFKLYDKNGIYYFDVFNLNKEVDK
jgi:hexosaminidase